MAAKAGRVWAHELDVVGLGHRLKRVDREKLAKLLDKGSITGMRLIPEPENPADPNAIKVCLPNRLMLGAHIGYLRRTSAEILAPRLASGSTKVLSATLLDLRAEDDLKEGSLAIKFRDTPKPAARKKTKAA